MKDLKANVTAVVRNPLDAAAQKVLIPAERTSHEKGACLRNNPPLNERKVS